MLRALVVLLLLANGLFFAWSRGWLSPTVPPPHQGEREPERLAAQVRPETIRLVTPQAASAAAAAAAPVCMEAGPFGDTDFGVAEAAMLAAGVPVGAFERRQAPSPGAWLVYMGRFADTTAQRTKEDELRRLKLTFDEVRTPPDLTPGLALSRHDSREAADAALAQANQRGVRSARVVALPSTAQQHWLRTPRADRDIQNRLAGLKPPVITAPFVRCAKG
jgi:hypothetical protein